MKVKLRITRETSYAKTLELSEAEYERLGALLDGTREERKQAEKELDGMIDPDDWVDDRLEDIDEFWPEKEETK